MDGMEGVCPMAPMMMVGLLVWGLLVLALLAGLVAGAVWLVRRGNRVGDRGDEAEAVLRRRYAAGELSDEEFQRRRATLQER